MAAGLREGSWNVARPERWLHGRHSAWLLFGVCACVPAVAPAPLISKINSPGLAEAERTPAALSVFETRDQGVLTSHGKQVCTTYSVTGCFHCRRAIASFHGRPLTAPHRTTPIEPRSIVEKLWHELISDPSQWWDHRSEKVNARYPDFKHKKTNQSLWLNGRWKPPWVEAGLAAIVPGALQPNIFSWNQQLLRYAKSGHYVKTMELFQRMQAEGVSPNEFTFVPVINACASLGMLERGRHIHKLVLEYGYEGDLFVGNSMVDMYAKCDSVEDAWQVFDKMTTHDVVSWNVIILGYVKCGQGDKALELSRRMHLEKVEPNSFTFVGLVNACASVTALQEGRRVHVQITQRGYDSDVFVSNSLIDMYIKCGNIKDAWKVFNDMPVHDVVAWSAVIAGYVKCGEGVKALELYRQMQEERVGPDLVTFVGLLNACASINALEEGRQIHKEIVQRGCEFDIYVCNSLVDMYAKCGSIGEAWAVFSMMSTRDVVAWTAMIIGYVKCGEGQKALELFRQMYEQGVEPNHITFVALLNACSSVAVLEKGKYVHQEIIRRGCQSDVYVGNGLIDMYAKCGSVEDSREIFDKMPMHDVVSWNTMLAAYAMHGHAKEALEHFERMSEGGSEMDGLTFVSLLSAFSHGGLVDEGLHYFESMSALHRISAIVEHHTCIVDLLGRAGRLHEAEDLIKASSSESNATVWTSLLGACRAHDNLEMGESVAKRVLELEPENAAGFVLLSHIYAATED